MTKEETYVLVNFPGHLTPHHKQLKLALTHDLLKTDMDIVDIEDYVVRMGIECGFDFQKNIHGAISIVEENGSYRIAEPQQIKSHFYRLLMLSLRDLFEEVDTHDVAFKAILRFSIPAKDVWLYGFESQKKNIPFAKWRDGSFKDPSSFSIFSKTKTMADTVAIHLIKNDDLEGLTHLMKNRQMNKVLSPRIDSLIGSFGKTSKNIHKFILDRIESSAVKLTPGKYVSSITQFLQNGINKAARDCYQPEFSKTAGHEILACLYRKELQDCGLNADASRLAEQLIKDGADWYLAYKLVSEGQAAYLDYLGREIKPFEEAVEILENKGVFDAVLKNVFISFDEETILSMATNTKNADSLHAATGNKKLLGLVSENTYRDVQNLL